MKKLILGGAFAGLLLAGGVFAYHVSTTRADCPGKIRCPLTGRVLCADQCPVTADATATAEVPDCCKAKTANP